MVETSEVLIILGTLVAVYLLYLAERVIKARRRAEHREQMASRLAAAAVRAEVQEDKRQSAAAASVALTSLMPAINSPPQTLEGVKRQAGRPQRGQRNTGPHGRPASGTGPGRPRGEQAARRPAQNAE
jgi:hypothetical protein